MATTWSTVWVHLSLLTARSRARDGIRGATRTRCAERGAEPRLSDDPVLAPDQVDKAAVRDAPLRAYVGDLGLAGSAVGFA